MNKDSKKGGSGKYKGKKSKSLEDKLGQKKKDGKVDYFPRGNDNQGEDYMFNQAPVLKQNKAKKGVNPLKRKQKVSQKANFSDSEDDPLNYSVNKQQKGFIDEGFLNQANSNFTSFFMLEKESISEISKVPDMKLIPNTYVWASVCDRGINNKYLVVNLNRNRKAYIQQNAISDNNPSCSEFQTGEFICGTVLEQRGGAKSSQLSLKVSDLNRGLSFEDIFEGQVISGLIQSQEDHGLRLSFGTKDRFQGFVRFSQKKGGDQRKSYSESRGYLFEVVKKDVQKRLLICDFMKQETVVSLKGQDEDELMGLDLQYVVRPGNQVRCSVVKLLENGLLVRFLGSFYGYVFEDFLKKQVSFYSLKEKLFLRVVGVNTELKQINLSEKHSDLSIFVGENVRVGDVFLEGFNIKRVVYGESIVVEPKGEENLEVFIHSSQIEITNKEKGLQEGGFLKKSLKIKELNYFDRVAVGTTLKEELLGAKREKGFLSWDSVEVGKIYEGKVSGLSEGKWVKVRLGENIQGVVDTYNLSDQKGKSKSYKEGQSIKVKVILKNVEEKILKLTVRPSLMQDDEVVNYLCRWEDVKGAKPYTGVISQSTENSFRVNFFQNVHGFLSYSDLEENQMKRAEFSIGQTVRTYASFLDKQKKILKLSLSCANFVEKGQKMEVKKVNDTLKEKVKVPEEGKVLEYHVIFQEDEKEEEKENNEYLVLECTDQSHKAIVLKNHLSDFKENCQKLFEFYKKQQNQKATLKAKVIQVEEDLNVWVSLKGTVLEEVGIGAGIKKNHSYFGWVDRKSRKGVVVKMGSEKNSAFCTVPEKEILEKLEQGETVFVKVKNLEQEENGKNKVLVTLNQQIETLRKIQFQDSKHPFLQFFAEEWTLQKKLVNNKKLKFKVGNTVLANVQKIKDYGVILTIQGDQGFTGFVTQANLSEKTFSVGQQVKCVVLDIDYEKEILDLIPAPEKDLKQNQVVLVKEHYSIFLKKQISQKKSEVDQQVGYLIGNFSGLVSGVSWGDVFDSVKCLNKEKQLQDVQFGKLSYLDICDLEEVQEQQSEQKKVSTFKILKEGSRVKGVVKGVKQRHYTLVLEGTGILGILNRSQVERVLEKGELVDCKVLGVEKTDKYTQVELSCLKEHLCLEDFVLSKQCSYPKEASQFLLQFKGVGVKGVIRQLRKDQIKCLQVELSKQVAGFVTIFDLVSLEQLSQFRVGQTVEVFVQSVENNSLRGVHFSLSQEKSTVPEVGQVLLAKILSRNKAGFRVQVGYQSFGVADLLDLSDDWLANPLNSFTVGSFYKARVISQKLDQYSAKLESQICLRESCLDENIWKEALSPLTGSSLGYKKWLGNEMEKRGDLRYRVWKLGAGSLKSSMIVLGYVSQCNNLGCLIKIAPNVYSRCQLHELSDQIVQNPTQQYQANKLVVARIKTVKQDGKIDVTMQETVVRSGYVNEVEKLQPGQIVTGTVSGYMKGKATVQVHGCRHRGTIAMKNIDLEGDLRNTTIEKACPLGINVTAKVVKVTREPKIKIKLAIGKKFVPEEQKEQTLNEEEKFIQEIINSVKETQLQEENEKKDVKNEIQFKNQKEESFDEQETEEEQESLEEEIENQQSFDEEEENIQEEQNSEIEIEDEEEDEEEDDDEIKSDQSLLEEEENQGVITNKKKSQRKKDLARRRKEEEIRKKELKLMNDDQQPETKDDFEKLILTNPNSSYIWIQYMAFNMEKFGIEEARQTAERALKVINFRSESERLNIWHSYMNLEHIFGTEASLIRVFKQAQQSCKPKEVFFKLLDIYRKAKKWEILLELSKDMIKKFKRSQKAWQEHFKNVILYRKNFKNGLEIENNQSIDLKELQKRALQGLKKKKHIILLSFLAKLLFENDSQEQGRTIFEGIVSNFPKRTDIWSVYLDMESNYGSLDSTRNLFERCIHLKLKPRKMKFFFKKYLQFELSRGTEEKSNLVRQKAVEYVQSINNVGLDMDNLSQEEDDDENQDQDKMEDE